MDLLSFLLIYLQIICCICNNVVFLDNFATKISRYNEEFQDMNGKISSFNNAIVTFNKIIKNTFQHRNEKVNKIRLRMSSILHNQVASNKPSNNDYIINDYHNEVKLLSAFVRKDILNKKGGSNNKKRILILLSDTGGGHRASAQAIEQAISEETKDKIDIDIMDIWTEHGKWPFNRFVPSYRYLAKHPLLWRLFYAYGQFPPTKLFTEVCSKLSCYESFKTAIKLSNPDVVVSVHPLCQLMPISIVHDLNVERKRMKSPGLTIPFITVVTDLGGAHSTWFDKRADYIFVPSEAIKTLAIKYGINPKKLVLRGLPVRPPFWKAAPHKVELRQKLGLSEDAKTILLMGGGDGVGGLKSIACEVGRKLGELSSKAQIVVVCGHNVEVANTLRNYRWPSNVKVQIKGFVNNIDEYMGASDCLVTKAGPGTIAEAMIRGVPIVLSSFLPGQEAGNVPFVLKGKFGLYNGGSPIKIASNVFKLCKDEEQLEIMSKRARDLSYPEATKEIAKDIVKITLRDVDTLPKIG